MRNLFWLALLLGLIGASARWLAQPLPSPQPTASLKQTQEELGFTWQEWGKVLTFVVQGNGHQVSAYLEGKEHSAGSELIDVSETGAKWSAQLCVRLRQEIEAAVEEPCQGKKTRELSLTQGSQSWNVEIGAKPGPAQQRIIDLIERSEIPGLRRRFPKFAKS